MDDPSRSGCLFIATCPCIDPKMDERIRRHQRDRKGKGLHWKERSRFSRAVPVLSRQWTRHPIPAVCTDPQGCRSRHNVLHRGDATSATARYPSGSQ
ncbi:MAG: hypothetical protein D3906_16470, partial [Candidatus Electrothrix sp. AUS1_2]|nr:hypothetical protein [Candidatus Electrothrix sp. AUS1_2]